MRRHKLPAERQRESKLDPLKTIIAECLEKDPSLTAAVIEQKLLLRYE
jgi:hypothetical protein